MTTPNPDIEDPLEASPQTSSDLAYKLMAITGVGMLLGIGLCGTGLRLQDYGISSVFYTAGITVFWLSGLGLVIAVIWLAIGAAMGK